MELREPLRQRRTSALRVAGATRRRGAISVGLFSAGLILVLAGTAAAAQFSPPKAIVGFHESQENVGPDQLPLDPIPGSTTNSDTFIIRQVGPIDVAQGDCLDVAAREELTNRNDANGWWTVNGVKSEHWWLWVSGHTTIRYSAGAPTTPAAGIPLLPETGQNWDYSIHHWHWDLNEVKCFDTAIPDVYLFTTVRFASSPGWRQSDSQYIENHQLGRIEAMHLGSP